MQFKQPNSIRDNFYRVIAVMITLCYILGPVHVQLNSVLHSISHNFKVPGYVIQHDGLSYKDYENQKFSEPEVVSNSLNHSHQLIDLVDGVFGAQSHDDKNQKGESTTIDFKINKHITSRKANIVFYSTIKREVPEFWDEKISCKTGYLLKLYRPPQV